MNNELFPLATILGAANDDKRATTVDHAISMYRNYIYGRFGEEAALIEQQKMQDALIAANICNEVEDDVFECTDILLADVVKTTNAGDYVLIDKKTKEVKHQQSLEE